MTDDKGIEREVFGVDYERFSLGRKIREFVQTYSLTSVCELPSTGAKAAPSLYSIDFVLAGAKVTLINGSKDSLRFYKELGVEKNVDILEVEDITNTPFRAESFDFVWNFAFIPLCTDEVALLNEMKRISKRFVSIFSVNGRNIGFPLHRIAHLLTKTPWVHGDTRLNSPSFLKRFFEKNGIEEIKSGVVDCPIWPDSLGFRDIRLHKRGISASNVTWQVPYVEYLKSGQFPQWFSYVYLFEKLPLPLFLKYIYAHIFYVIGET